MNFPVLGLISIYAFTAGSFIVLLFTISYIILIKVSLCISNSANANAVFILVLALLAVSAAWIVVSITYDSGVEFTVPEFTGTGPPPLKGWFNISAFLALIFVFSVWILASISFVI